MHDHCPHCGEALYHQRADDAPAYFVILIVGHLVVPLALSLELALSPTNDPRAVFTRVFADAATDVNALAALRAQRKSVLDAAIGGLDEIKQQLLTSLTNHGRPVIRVVDGNYRNRGELYLKHDYLGVELRQDYARATLENLCRLWSRPVHVESVIDDEPAILSFDGIDHDVSPA